MLQQFKAAQYLRLAEERGGKAIVGNSWYVPITILLPLHTRPPLTPCSPIFEASIRSLAASSTILPDLAWHGLAWLCCIPARPQSKTGSRLSRKSTYTYTRYKSGRITRLLQSCPWSQPASELSVPASSPQVKL